MSLAHGGHLTHGHPVSVNGQLWNAVQYGVRPEDGRLDYDQVERLAREHRPRLLVAGASAYPRIIDFARLGAIAREVGATLVVDMAHIAGLVAAGLHPSPVPHADLVSGGTDNHLLLVDLRGRAMTGKAAEEALHRARITVNKNAVPNDPQKPWVTSGIRLGTPALTTRGFGVEDMDRIAGWIARVLEAPNEPGRAHEVEAQVLELCHAYPLFTWEPVARRAARASG